MLNSISSSDIVFHPHSFGDHQLRLFRWHGEIYRGIGSTRAASFAQLFEAGIIQHLIDQGLLIKSELVSININDYKLIVRHRTIPFISYPNEWCAVMLRDAALTLLDLATELTEYGFTLGDAHPWNLLFDIENCRPVFVDLGSILPIYNPIWPVYEEFCRYCFYPLLLMAHGQDQIARLLMWEDSGVTKSELLSLVGKSILSEGKTNSSLISHAEFAFQKYIQKVPETYRKFIKIKLRSAKSLLPQEKAASSSSLKSSKTVRNKSHADFLNQVKQNVLNIPLPTYNKNYLEKDKASFLKQDKWTETQRTVGQVLTDFNPSSVLALGNDLGWSSKLAATLGSQVIAFDTDHHTVTQLYYHTREHELPILPLIMDFTKSTPARGLADHWSIAASNRLACDMVLALGLVDSIVSKRCLNFEQIIEGFDLFSKRWLLVEFIEAEDPIIKQWWSDKFYWYTLENFIDALEKKFKVVKSVSAYPSNRRLLLCEK